MENKGYTLTELLITMAIFSIVMVCISRVLIMSSTVYKNESYEVGMQEDATLILAQVDELLVDCTEFTDNSGGKYTVKASDGLSYVINFDSSNNILTLNGETISNCVSDFKIEGYAASATADNAVKVNLSLDENGYKYSSEKAVYFRNNIENPNINIISTTVGGGGSTSSDKVCDVKRYAVVDLKALYGIDSGWTMNSNASSKFKFCDKDGNDSDVSTYFVKTNDTINKSLDSTVTKTSNCIISSGATQVYLTLDAVKFEVGTGIIVAPATKSDNGSQDSFNVQGLDMYWLAKRGTCSVTVSPYVDNNGNKQLDSNEVSSFASRIGESNGKCKSITNGLGVYYPSQTINNGTVNGLVNRVGSIYDYDDHSTLKMKVMGDYFGGGYCLNYNETAAGGKKDKFQDGKCRVNIKFKIPSGNSTKTYCCDFNYFCMGSDLKNAKGGNVYTE